jgi:UrcA family protein
MYVRTLSLLGAIVATAANVAFVTPAAAQAEERVTVSYAGLDLSNPADAARFDNRVRAAVRKVCGSGVSKDVRVVQWTIACREGAMARASADIQVALRGAGGGAVALTTN